MGNQLGKKCLLNRKKMWELLTLVRVLFSLGNHSLSLCYLIMFDETWSEIVEAPGEIYDVIEYKEEWEKDDKFNVEDYINGNTDYWCLKHFQSNAHLTNSFQFTWNSCYSAALFFFFGLILRHVQSSVMVYTMPLRLCVLIDTNRFDSQVFLLLRIAAASVHLT